MTNLKECKRCNLKLPGDAYYKNRRKPDGLDIYCKGCCKIQQAASFEKHKSARKAKQKEWREKNPEKMNEYSKQWRARNPERAAEVQAANYRRHRERYLEADRQRRLANIDVFLERERENAIRNAVQRGIKERRWRAENPHKVAAYAAARRAALSLRVPKWLTEVDHIKIQDFYDTAARITLRTGIPHHVDHILPLRGRLVSGLHTPANMRVITAEENLRKSNRWGPL